MDVTPLVKEGAQIIQSYAGGSFRVSGQRYDGAVLVSSSGTSSWDVSSFDIKELKLDAFSYLVANNSDIDVVLLGTGQALIFPDPSLKAWLKEQGLHIEVMDTGAACRTYNVLMAEGRRVVAALLPF